MAPMRNAKCGAANVAKNTNFQPSILQLDKIGYRMTAAPLAGLLVQPILGYMSDRTWRRWATSCPTSSTAAP